MSKFIRVLVIATWLLLVTVAFAACLQPGTEHSPLPTSPTSGPPTDSVIPSGAATPIVSTAPTLPIRTPSGGTPDPTVMIPPPIL
jgi:hypothetical protein